MTIEELGQRVKAKHPEYSQMDDADVGNRVVAKFPEYQSQIDSKPVNATENPMIGAIKQGANAALQTINMPYNLGQKFNEGSQAAGENVAEALGGKGVNPYVSATAGMATQIATNPLSYVPTGGAAPLGIGEGTAQNAGIRALGFTKRFLGKPGALQSARDTAQTMLDQGVLKPFSGAESTLARAENLGEQSGKTITEGMKALDDSGYKAFDTKDIAAKVSKQLKPAYSGGAYDAEHAALNEIKDTILAHGEGPISFKSAQALKEKLQDLGKFDSGTSQIKTNMYRRASGIIRQALEDSVDNAIQSATPETTALANPKDTTAVVPQDLGIQPPGTEVPLQETLGNYLTAKKNYGASQRAQSALLNRVSSLEGNNRIGLRESMLLAHQLGSGNVPGAAATALTLGPVASRFNTTLATGANALSKARVNPLFLKGIVAGNKKKLLGQ